MTDGRDYLVYFLAILVLCAGAAGMYDDLAVPATRGSGATAGSASQLAALPAPFAGISRLRLALMGADERPGDVGRSDTLMVVWLNPQTKRAAIMSLPRDLKVAIPGHGVGKINAAYAHGGPELTVRTVSEYLGVPLDGYVKVNFEGFVKAVDILGGVDVLVEDVEGKGRGMNYDDNWGNLHIHLTPGWHHLNGYEAMGFCRYRKSMYHGLGDGDFKRAERQQQFLRAMVQQKLRVQNLPQLLKAGREIMGCVETTLTWRQVIDLARLLKEMGAADIKTVVLPARDDSSGGVYYCSAAPDDVRQVLAEVEQHLEGATRGSLSVALLDGSGQKGLADQAEELLKAAGFTVVSTSAAAESRYDATRIRYPEAAREAALAIATTLGAGQLEPAPDHEPAPAGQEPALTVIIGRDFAQHVGAVGSR